MIHGATFKSQRIMQLKTAQSGWWQMVDGTMMKMTVEACKEGSQLLSLKLNKRNSTKKRGTMMMTWMIFLMTSKAPRRLMPLQHSKPTPTAYRQLFNRRRQPQHLDHATLYSLEGRL
jgi:hypothetical protein